MLHNKKQIRNRRHLKLQHRSFHRCFRTVITTQIFQSLNLPEVRVKMFALSPQNYTSYCLPQVFEITLCGCRTDAHGVLLSHRCLKMKSSLSSFDKQVYLRLYAKYMDGVSVAWRMDLIKIRYIMRYDISFLLVVLQWILPVFLNTFSFSNVITTGIFVHSVFFVAYHTYADTSGD